jgi:hypothetical protein
MTPYPKQGMRGKRLAGNILSVDAGFSGHDFST